MISRSRRLSLSVGGMLGSQHSATNVACQRAWQIPWDEELPLQKRAQLGEYQLRNLFLEVMAARQSCARYVHALLLPDRQDVENAPHRALQSPQRQQRARDLLR